MLDAYFCGLISGVLLVAFVAWFDTFLHLAATNEAAPSTAGEISPSPGLEIQPASANLS